MAYEEFLIRQRYKTVAEIGRGGMSVVHLAQDLNIGAGSLWAIKQVKNSSSVEFDAFLKEVELLASLSHPDIPRIVDRIEIGDDYYVVMDLISGISLSKLVNMEGPQEEEKVIQWAVSLASILEYLHAADAAHGKKPIVYRDMKPDNVMLTPTNEVKLIDFGIAKEYVQGKRIAGESLGTRGYAAPEQYKGASNILDARSDIYSLGATLYYLSTGFTPEPPPHGVPSVRAKNPELTDAFEFVVAKCTTDDPELRYQNFADLKKDLENIKLLSGLHRKKMKRHLLLFWSSFLLSFVFFAVGLYGYLNVKKDLQGEFQYAYQTAAAYQREGDFLKASQYYAQSLRAKPDDRETHLLLFHALLPQDGAAGDKEKIIAAVDEMRKGYLDNTASPMYQDPQLCYAVARKCIEVEDAAYAQIALDYIKIIKESAAKGQAQAGLRELQALEAIATFQVQDSTTADFDQFQKTLEDLYAYTDQENLTTDERLNNYYLLVRLYSTYPVQLKDAFEQVYQIGGKARNLLLRSISDDTIVFNSIVPLYELVATSQFNRASVETYDTDREQAYQNSIQWFGYLDELKTTLPENLALKKANAYKGVFDLYNTPQRSAQIDTKIEQYLDKAIGFYEEILSKNSQSLITCIYLTQAYYEKAMLTPEAERSFTNVLKTYAMAENLVQDKAVSSITRMQFASLTNLLKNAGIGG